VKILFKQILIVSHVVEAMNSLELLVVQEIFMSETAKLATVVLPGTTLP
jgi:formate dehydrogenase major subunit